LSDISNAANDWELGSSLLELMAVILLIAIMAVMTVPIIHQQMAAREMDLIARRFIAHAQLARSLALSIGVPAFIRPLNHGSWDEGWLLSTACLTNAAAAHCVERVWYSQASLGAVYFKGGGKQFIDPHSGQKGIGFNAAGAAKATQGGFVANRLILGHRRAPELELHLILASGGRWRICDPDRDLKSCR
jgi:type IV fimbrial biogenesis protein FimT